MWGGSFRVSDTDVDAREKHGGAERESDEDEWMISTSLHEWLIFLCASLPSY